MDTHRAQRSLLSRKQFLSIIEAGILAPSADNKHSLLFDQLGNAIRVWGSDEFFAAPFHRRVLFLISLGAVVENLAVQARSLGLETVVTWFPDRDEPRLAAELQVTGATATTDGLAGAIPLRRTNRRFFRGPPATAAQQRALDEDAAAVDGTRLIWLDQGSLRRNALRLVRTAETERFRCKHLHDELFSCVRFEAGWNAVVEEGLAPGSLEVERVLRGVFKAIRHWGLMHALTYIGAHYVLGLRAGDVPCRLSPHLGVITTTLDLEAGAVAVGRAFERVWLRATSFGLGLQPLAASTLLSLDGYQHVRPIIRRKLARGWAKIAPGVLPLIVFRFGWAAPPTLRSGRRTLETYLR